MAGRCAVTAVAVALAVVIATAAGASAAAPLHALVIVSPQTLTLTPKGKPATSTKAVVVRNDGPAVNDLAFKAVGKEGDKITVKPDRTTIDADSAASIVLTFSPNDRDIDFSGVLLATATGATPGSVALSLAPQKAAAWWLYLVIFLPLVGAAGLVIVRWLTFGRAGCRLGSRVGPANWDFSKSWGSNLTVVGALLGTILSAGVLPDETATSKATYAGLNLLFGVLILVAPLLYTATQTPNDVHRTKTFTEPQYEGYVWSFLAASAITLWAAVGELTTVILLFREIHTARSLPDAAVYLMAVLAGAAAVLLAFYAFRTLGWILRRQCQVQRLKEEKHAELRAAWGDDAPAPADIEPERPEWSVL